ncbi:hypothetical protein FN846DRAFT_564991 [Sphaerosporella brunnea]|uniref:Uncharacterized protein n=1 Tax=Sphaerosporella brunnea TaxID=1250544 RepID=A0A5J5FBA5_9PEZI|nr:hypothetical protein FN846DRAFT_564991 [Sphaerosporella brunnea]
MVLCRVGWGSDGSTQVLVAPWGSLVCGLPSWLAGCVTPGRDVGWAVCQCVAVVLWLVRLVWMVMVVGGWCERGLQPKPAASSLRKRKRKKKKEKRKRKEKETQKQKQKQKHPWKSDQKEKAKIPAGSHFCFRTLLSRSHLEG